MGRATEHLTVDGRRIPVSNLDKVLYPGTSFTKARAIDYYIRVAEYLLPHMKNRPVTLKRFPDGVGGEFFYEKDAPSFTPDWVQTFPVPRRDGGTHIRYILINDVATLVWLANLANLEIHPFLHRVPRLDRPTDVVLDLDPGEGAGILDCARVAILLRNLLQQLSLECFVKVSGSKGLQMYVPLNTEVTYRVTQPFAHALAQLVERSHGELAVSEMPRHIRSGKVFIDWSQNADFKTTAGVYSLRAKSVVPYVSLPVEWEELSAALQANDARRLYWTPSAALERLDKLGDLFARVLKLEQRLPAEVEAYLETPGRTPGTRGSGSKLGSYKEKRNFTRTPEPAPTIGLVS
jgi:bifunctional non-homologous end joining protein LigD